MSTITHSPLHIPRRSHSPFKPLAPLRRWLNRIPIRDRRLAHLICRFIPPTCPFARDITLFGHTLVHIPPLCKLNPFYNEFTNLRFHALTYLANIAGEDITPYI